MLKGDFLISTGWKFPEMHFHWSERPQIETLETCTTVGDDEFVQRKHDILIYL